MRYGYDDGPFKPSSNGLANLEPLVAFGQALLSKGGKELLATLECGRAQNPRALGGYVAKRGTRHFSDSLCSNRGFSASLNL